MASHQELILLQVKVLERRLSLSKEDLITCKRLSKITSSMRIMQNCVLEIEPIDNRLVLFRNSDKSYHGVPAVKKETILVFYHLVAIFKMFFQHL